MQVRVFEGFTSGLQATEEFMVQVAASIVGAVILAPVGQLGSGRRTGGKSTGVIRINTAVATGCGCR